MAITGNGTSANPYVVHDYWELKTVCKYETPYIGYEGYTKYVELANDIDCNSDAYPNTFEWEGIKLWGSSTVVDLNLKGKSIKNIMIANGSFLFEGHNSDGYTSKIHNGKILNVFCNNSDYIITYPDGGGNAIYCKLENLSMSINGTSLQGTAFGRCAIDSCSLYYVSAKLNANIFSTVSYNSQYSNTDFYFDVAETNNKFAYLWYYGEPVWNNCRFGGKLGGRIPSDWITRATNIVVDTELTYSGGSYFIRYATGIINSSKATNSTGMECTLTWVNSTEIKNAATLTGKGFTVTDINPSST